MSSALLVDLDGTLADSLGVLRQVYFGFLEARGRSGSAAEFESLNGPPIDEVVRRLRRGHHLDETEAELSCAYLEAVARAYSDVAIRAGGRELLEQARSAGWGVGIVTSSLGSVVRPWLARHGLEIDVLVTAADVTAGKPDPEPFRVALKRLGAASAISAGVEDSAAGAAAALAAGLRTYVVGSRSDDWPPGARWCSDLRRVAEELFDV